MSTAYYPLRAGDRYPVEEAEAMARQMWPDEYDLPETDDYPLTWDTLAEQRGEA